MSRAEYIASDVHLGAVPDSTERAFVRFLEHVGASGSGLLLAGDLFDFWFEYGTIIPGRHFRTLGALAALCDAGLPVTLAGGNHDAWGGRFLREHVGVRFHEHPFHMELGGRRALVAHGDGLGKGDLKYRMLKAVLRSRAAIWGFRALHPELGLRLAQKVSSTGAKPDEGAALRGRAAFLESWARQQLAEDASLSWVVCGHAHLPALVEAEPGRWYVNAGDWLRHYSYVVIEGGVPRLEHWPAQAARP
ncbi:MAG TPA: UDP-2,3-diacylglucosamine diphosphatase [Longimicrobiales bacterium]|nr:UDP-2,3-diacylglucosamine diphosphatase [Longimicrobiales bacterium]